MEENIGQTCVQCNKWELEAIIDSNDATQCCDIVEFDLQNA